MSGTQYMKQMKKPKILNIKNIAESRLFRIQSVDLEFSNGVKRLYERMQPTINEAVLIVPIINNELILIREYAVGIEEYELGFPKGAIDKGESAIQAAIRELKEEIGYGAKHVELLAKLTISPAYFSSKMNIFIAQNLYEEKLEGDEPEPLEQIRWPINNMMQLLDVKDFNEARNISALFYAQRYLKNIS
uniref:ADP compounds hydrolase n=2 Tax=Arsenophonus nasoniae TaxID=638 RepID=D2U384_9GAMM|nr:ADP compounds hydrolase [Arsenophonus nasoniae]